jgi:RNA polymerase sigma-70 factor (ECF subfamily)
MQELIDDFRSLIERAGRGDSEALAQLTQQYESKIRIVARVHLGPVLRPYLDSMDLVQSVHRLMLLGLREERFDLSSPAKLVNLAILLVKRKVWQKWRRLRRQQRREAEAGPASDWVDVLASLASPEPDPARAAESRDFLHHVLAGLAPQDEQLLQLYLDGYRQREISEQLGISYQAVRMRLLRVRERLQAGGLLADWLPRVRAADGISLSHADQA